MTTLANTTENNAKVKALKAVENTVGKIFWVGNIIQDNLDKCLVGLNLESTNSGWYNPIAVKINGLTVKILQGGVKAEINCAKNKTTLCKYKSTRYYFPIDWCR